MVLCLTLIILFHCFTSALYVNDNLLRMEVKTTFSESHVTLFIEEKNNNVLNERCLLFTGVNAPLLKVTYSAFGMALVRQIAPGPEHR